MKIEPINERELPYSLFREAIPEPKPALSYKGSEYHRIEAAEKGLDMEETKTKGTLIDKLG
ncbi:MAG: hypothetical protein QW331_03860 [Candidatus Woesearchaeota archaeon]